MIRTIEALFKRKELKESQPTVPKSDDLVTDLRKKDDYDPFKGDIEYNVIYRMLTQAVKEDLSSQSIVDDKKQTRC